MKQTAFLFRSLLLVTMMGWTLMSQAQRYEIIHGRVIFCDEVMMQVDTQSFVDLGCGYAKDKMNVYLNGRVLENVDPSTFRLKERPASHHFRHGEMNEPMSAHKGYFKTNFNVYYGDKKIDAMASSFEDLGDGYAKDSFNVYYFGEKLKGCMASNFKILEGGYAKDRSHVWYLNDPVIDADVESFKVTDGGVGYDKNGLFKGVERVKPAAPADNEEPLGVE